MWVRRRRTALLIIRRSERACLVIQKLAPTWPASSACRAGAGDAAAVALTVQLVLLQVIRVGGQTQVYCFTEDQALRGLHGGDSALYGSETCSEGYASYPGLEPARLEAPRACSFPTLAQLMWKRLGSDAPQQSAADICG